MHYPLINNSFLTGFEALLAERGLDPEALLRRVHLDPALLRKPDTLIPFDRHNQALLAGAEALACPHLGLELARRQGLVIFGPLAAMTTDCNTVGEALAVFIRHLPLVVQTVQLSLTQKGALTFLCIESQFPKVGETVTFQDHALGLAYDLIKVLCGSQWVPRAAYLPHPEPADARHYANFFHCPIGFNHPLLALVFDTGLLGQPIHPDAKLVPRRLRQYLAHEHRDDLLLQLKHVIALTLATDECDLHSVARALGYSGRTLQRRLAPLQTSFKLLVDEVRLSQATSYLRQPYYRLTDVAAMLGYSELSAFTRSFKRWMGISPQRWRRQWTSASPV